MTVSDFTDSIYYEIFINQNGSNHKTYLLSSRSVIAFSGARARFCIGTVQEGRVAPDDISMSNGTNEQYTTLRFRPVITLNSNVITTGGDGQSAETAYQISI